MLLYPDEYLYRNINDIILILEYISLQFISIDIMRRQVEEEITVGSVSHNIFVRFDQRFPHTYLPPQYR